MVVPQHLRGRALEEHAANRLYVTRPSYGCSDGISGLIEEAVLVKITVDFRLLESRIELSGLHEALEIMENQIHFLAEQRKVQAAADLEALADEGVEWDDGDVQLTLRERDHAVEHLYPRLFRGPFLVTLWAIYESGLNEVARFVKRNKKVQLDIDEIRGSDIRRRAKRYFEAVLGVEIASDQTRAGELGKLYRVRNAFAHANGRLGSLKHDVRKSIESMIAEGQLEESIGYIIPSKIYVADACEVVHAELSELVDGAIAWHEKIKGADERVL